MTSRKPYRRHGDLILTVILLASIGFVAYGCGHEDEPTRVSLVRQAGW